MSPQPERDTTAGRVYNDLRNLARRQGRPTDELFQLYLLERFLFRLAQSRLRDRLVLKGGTLLAAYALRRPTKDIDAQAQGIANDADDVAALVRDVMAIEVDDGLTFHVDGLIAETIREGAAYEGVRVRVPVSLGPAELTFRLDVNFGDPITPAPTEVSYPQLLGGEFDLVGYPLASVLAEKLVTMLELRDANTRERDVGDIVRIARSHQIDGRDLAAACRATADYRDVPLEPLRSVLVDLAQRRQAAWSRWLDRYGLGDELPASFAGALEEVIAFADPVLDGHVDDAVWNPGERHWRN